MTPTSNKGVSLEVVEEYKHLGMYLDHKVDWSKNRHCLQEGPESLLLTEAAEVLQYLQDDAEDVL